MFKTYVLYHGGCSDGFCAAWVAYGVLGDAAEYIPVRHGQAPPEMEQGATVYVLDFSYKRDVMVDIADAADRVVVLDHHATAEKELAGLNGVGDLHTVFDMGKSGGRLTWEHFHGGKTAPWLVDYTEDRDLWRWNMTGSREINAALRSYPMTFEQWDTLDEVVSVGGFGPLIGEGRAILRDQAQTVASHVKHAREIELAGHKVLAVNATTLTSEIAGELAKGRPFGACYFDRHDGKRVWSLRSAPDGIDVSEVAKSLGGGGHKNAAGFEV